MDAPSSPGAVLLGAFAVLGAVLVYAAWRLALSIRRRDGGREVAGRLLQLLACGMFLYGLGVHLRGGGAPGRVPIELVAAGLLLLGSVLRTRKPRSAEQK